MCVSPLSSLSLSIRISRRVYMTTCCTRERGLDGVGDSTPYLVACFFRRLPGTYSRSTLTDETPIFVCPTRGLTGKLTSSRCTRRWRGCWDLPRDIEKFTNQSNLCTLSLDKEKHRECIIVTSKKTKKEEEERRYSLFPRIFYLGLEVILFKEPPDPLPS